MGQRSGVLPLGPRSSPGLSVVMEDEGVQEGVKEGWEGEGLGWAGLWLGAGGLVRPAKASSPTTWPKSPGPRALPIRLAVGLSPVS